jgi:hypothetical protein
MKMIIPRFLTAAAFGAAMLLPIMPTLRADDHRNDHHYHDKDHNDDHEWNSHEDRAYRIWAKQNHRKYRDFSKLRDEDQQSYWRWRHDHSDAILKINIR